MKRLTLDLTASHCLSLPLTTSHYLSLSLTPPGASNEQLDKATGAPYLTQRGFVLLITPLHIPTVRLITRAAEVANAYYYIAPNLLFPCSFKHFSELLTS